MHINIEGKDGPHDVAWQEGKSLLIDDVYPHEVWNDTDDDRYILLLQVQRPCRGPARLLLVFLLFCVRHSRFVQDINRQLDEMTANAATLKA